MNMKFLNWPKVLWTIKYLNDLNNKPYFDLKIFCDENNLNHIKITNFLEIANSIINGNSELIKAIEGEKETLEKLNNLDPSVLYKLSN